MCEVFDNILYCQINGSTCIGKDIQEDQNAIFNKSEVKEDLIIPAFIGHHKVNYIGEWAFRSCTIIKRVNIEARIDTIKYGAFEYCTSLESINIPSTVKTLGRSAIRVASVGLGSTIQGTLNVTFEKGSRIKSIGSQALRGKYDTNVFFCEYRKITKEMCVDKIFTNDDNPHIYSHYSFCGLEPEGKPFGCYNRETRSSCKPRQNARTSAGSFIYSMIFVLTLS